MAEKELSIVIPTLNEEKTLGFCIQKAQKAINSLGINGEIIVADYRSTDRTVEIAKSMGTTVIPVEEKGYGFAYITAIAHAKGDYIIMGDADDSYNFEEIAPFWNKLKEGYDFVMGSRFKGKIEKGAMPFLHRHLGTPVLTFIINLFFKTNFSDSNCGMRAFSKKAFAAMELKTTGMEFASEMVIKAGLARLKIAEVPCNLYRDKRDRRPHLRPWRDGWRNLRFILLFTPKWTFLVPGAGVAILGMVGLIGLTIRDLINPQFMISHMTQKHMISSSILFLLGCQILEMGLTARMFSESKKFETSDPYGNFFNKYFQLERGIVSGLLSFSLGLAVFLYLFLSKQMGWFYQMSDILRFDVAIYAMLAIFLGIQIIFISFLLSLFQLPAK